MLKSNPDFIKFFEQEYLEIGDITVNFNKSKITIEVYNLIVMDTHPNVELLGTSDTHILEFRGIRQSIRQFSKYEGLSPHEKLKENIEFTDGPFPETTEATMLFNIAGVLRNPRGWIDWNIEAISFNISPALNV